MKWIVFVLSCLSLTAYSQDYVVTNKGDTLNGKVKLLSYGQIDNVQVLQNKKKTVLTALQVKTVLLDGERFRPARKDNTIRFMKSLKTGYLSLLSFRVENTGSYDGRFLVKMDGTGVEVPNLNFRKVLANFLSDCLLVSQKIGTDGYGRGDLEKIIDEFNACMESDSQFRKKTEYISPEQTDKIRPLEELKKTVEGLTDFGPKKDALDLINDMLAKLRTGSSVPNYQLDALKGYLEGNESTESQLEDVLTALKPN